MEENDTLTYQVRRSPQNQETLVDQSLISQERTQKLDLLMHLVANLSQALVVCGPNGIGKTTLLKVLQQRKVNSWVYCPVQGSTELSFEKILEHIADYLSRDKPKSDRSLSTSYGQHESQNKKIILMIDDAGDLVPGLITTLIHYAAANPVLRLIFVLTHDDVSLKNRTDRIIEDCHFVEIPPLSEKQCGVFLHHLAKKPFAPIAFNSISDSLIENIYRETHGIPGRIVAKLPDLVKSKSGQNATLILSLAVIGLVVIALAIQWLSASNSFDGEKPVPIRVAQKAVLTDSDSSQPGLSLKAQPLFLSEEYIQEKSAGIVSGHQQVNKSTLEANKANGVINSPGAIEIGAIDNNKSEEKPKTLFLGPNSEKKSQPSDFKSPLSANNTPSPDMSKTEQPSTLAAADNELASEEDTLQETGLAETGRDWINAQPSESFTLQIMVLTKEQAIKDIIEKHKDLGRTLTYIKIGSSNSREKFLLLYGSYASANLAYKARQSLPPEFRKAYARKFSSIKNKAESIR
jgi:DamX protein